MALPFKWGTKMRNILSFAALAATIATATPAFAQAASSQAEARGVVVQPLTLARVQDLDFGTVVGSAVAGTVDIDADTGGRTVTGGVVGVPSYPGDRALFQGAGTSGQDVILTLNAPTLLISQSNPLDTITVNSMTLRQRQFDDPHDRRDRHVQCRRRRQLRDRREPGASALFGEFRPYRRLSVNPVWISGGGRLRGFGRAAALSF